MTTYGELRGLADLKVLSSRERRPNLVEQLADVLRHEISSGSLGPGDRLPTESELGALSGVSRTVVREAVAALRAEGLVETRQGAGAFVLASNPRTIWVNDIANATVEEILYVLEIRLAIEVEAATLASTRRTEQDLEAMKRAMDEFSRLRRSGADTIHADLQFHEALAAATHNPRFLSLLKSLGEFAFPRRHLPAHIRDMAASENQLTLVEQEHRAIFDAVAAQESTIAAMAVRVHLGGSRVRYAALLREELEECDPVAT